MNEIFNLTAEECENLVRRHPKSKNGSPVSYKLVPLGEGRTGILGEHYILKIKTKDPQQEDVTFFVKTIPQMESMTFFANHVDVFYKEESFYRKIVPAMKEMGIDLLGGVIARWYMIRTNLFLVFEDLAALGFKTLSTIHSLSYETIEVSLKTLAKFHACSFIYEERMSKRYGREYRMTEDFSKELEEMFFCAKIASEKLAGSALKGAETLLQLFPDVYEDLDKREFENFVLDSWRNVKEIVKPSDKFRNVICHGDVQSNNMLHKEENALVTDCLLVDFQLYRYSPPAQDVVTFLYLSTDREFRNKHMSEWLDLYYRSLSATLLEYHVGIEEVLSKADFRKSCEHYEVFAMSQRLSYSMTMKLDPKIVKELFDDAEAGKRFMFVDRSDVLREFCGKDPYYEGQQKESLVNFKDAFVKSKRLQNNLQCTTLRCK